MDDMLQERIKELLAELEFTEKGTEEYERIARSYYILKDAEVNAFKADSDDVNNNNRNKVEKAKARYEMITKIVTAIIGAGVTIKLAGVIVSVEEIGAVTTKVLGFIPKWKF